jgi:hypothetical protein
VLCWLGARAAPLGGVARSLGMVDVPSGRDCNERMRRPDISHAARVVETLLAVPAPSKAAQPAVSNGRVPHSRHFHVSFTSDSRKQARGLQARDSSPHLVKVREPGGSLPNFIGFELASTISATAAGLSETRKQEHENENENENENTRLFLSVSPLCLSVCPGPVLANAAF